MLAKTEGKQLLTVMNDINTLTWGFCISGLFGIGAAWLLVTFYTANILNPQTWFSAGRTFVKQGREKVAVRENVYSSVAEGLRPSATFRLLLTSTLVLLCGGVVGILWLFIQVLG